MFFSALSGGGMPFLVRFEIFEKFCFLFSDRKQKTRNHPNEKMAYHRKPQVKSGAVASVIKAWTVQDPEVAFAAFQGPGEGRGELKSANPLSI